MVNVMVPLDKSRVLEVMFCISVVRFHLTIWIQIITFKSVKCLYGVPYYIVRVRLTGPLKYPTKVVVEDTILTHYVFHRILYHN